MPYVVVVMLKKTLNAQYIDEYLCAIRFDLYQIGNMRPTITSPDLDEAFKFQSLAAAEMSAVFVGGRVQEIP